MFFKLSLRNIKRSISDYAIYFLTITLAVALFYVFNSINEQQVMLDLTTSQSQMINQLSSLMTVTSVIVSIVFFMLCLFANRFFIKRRKKEFGLYMSLGMGKGEISKILLFETILIAIVALGVGIGLGTLISQGMAAVTAALFNIKVASYQFIFSKDAMMQTIGFFSIIFILVLLFNSISISSYTLLDLLTASRKSEKVKMKNTKLSAVIFIISVILIVLGYVVTWSSNLIVEPVKFIIGVSCILVGTFVFYYTGMSFLITVAQKNKNFYFKGINTFTIRQISSKLTATFSSVIMIHVMLLFTLSILSGSFSYKSALDAELAIVAPYDVSLSMRDFSEILGEEKLDTRSMLEKYDFNLDQFDNYIMFDRYRSGLVGNEVLYPYALGPVKANMEEGAPYYITAIRYSDYQKLQQLLGKKAIELKDDETLILTNMSDVIPTIENLTNHVKEFEISGKILKLHDEKYQVTAIETENVGRTIACLVVPDELTEQLEVETTLLNIMYDEFSEEQNERLNSLFESWYTDPKYNIDEPFQISGITKTEAYHIVAGETTSILYIGIYLGIVFLVSSGAVIGLRQLSDAADEVDRYTILRKIGVTSKEINKSIFLQVFISFMTPLFLAVIHCIFIINYMTKYLSATGSYNLLIPASITIGVLVLIYGGYMLASYNGYKKIVTK